MERGTGDSIRQRRSPQRAARGLDSGRGGVCARQRGISLGGLLMASFILIAVAMIGFKLIPPYLQFLSVQKTMQAVIKDPAMKDVPPEEYRRGFAARAQVENITAISAADLQIAKQGNVVEISAVWAVKVPLTGNVSLCLDFTAKSSGRD